MIYVMGRNITDDGREFLIQGVYTSFDLAIKDLQNDYWIMELPKNTLFPYELQHTDFSWWKLEDKIYRVDNKGNIIEEVIK